MVDESAPILMKRAGQLGYALDDRKDDEMSAVGFYRRNSKKIEFGMFLFACGFFAFAVLDWLGVIPYDGYRPKKMVFLGAAMVHASVALLTEKFQKVSFALLAICIVLLFFSFTAKG